MAKSSSLRILLCSASGDGAWFYTVLANGGHKVDWTLKDDKFNETLAGIIPPPLSKEPDPDDYDLIVFDDSKDGELADEMRQVTPIIGSSALADRLEHDRTFGIEFMEGCGINVPPYETFTSVDEAKAWLKEHDIRTVFKPSGERGEDCATTYVSQSAEDMINYLDKLTKKAKVDEFLLQEFVEGTEVSTEAWFNGEEFHALNHTLEEKKFLAGGIGPNTGCAGNVLWMPSGPTKLFTEGLAKTKTALMAANFVGPMDLNVIATEDKVYGLEWTPRFGYEGACNLVNLLPMDFGRFLYAIATGEDIKAGSAVPFAASVRISVPPYPNPSNPKKYAGVPVKGIDHDDLDAFYLSDVKVNDDGELETIGTDGLIGAPVGTGDTIKSAFAEVQRKIDKLQIPDLMYRNDIESCCQRRYDELERNGWL